MKVQFSFVGTQEPLEDVWVNLEQIPGEGDNIYFRATGEIVVRSIVWYPIHNDEDEELSEPQVYVVVGPHRSESVPSHLERYLGRERPSDDRTKRSVY